MSSQRLAHALTISVLLATGLVTGCATNVATTSTSEAQSSPTESTPAPAVSSAPLLENATETVLGEPIAYPSASPAQVSSSIITLQPGAETGLHRHDAPMYAYILDGVLTVTYDGGIEKTYRTGDAIMEAVGTAHNGKNTGDKPVTILVVNIGAEGVANTVKLP